MPGSIRGPENCCSHVRVCGPEEADLHQSPSLEIRPLPTEGPLEFVIDFEVGAVLHSLMLYSTAMRVEVYVDGRTPAELNASAAVSVTVLVVTCIDSF